jgi:hypothetical protein
MSRSAAITGVGMGLVALVGLSAAAAQNVPVLNNAVVVNVCEPITIAIGDMSGYGWDIPGFMGEDLLIRDGQTWAQFWAQHTSNIIPPPPLPPVDFSRYVVIAAIQGHQSTGGMAAIYITGIRHWPSPTPPDRAAATVMIVDDERPGMLDVITNPFHIVMVARACLPPNGSVTFRHQAPAAGTGIVRGHVFGRESNSTDWQPLFGATVRLGQAAGTPGSVTRTGLDGSYFFVNVAPETYVLSASFPGYQSQTVTITVRPDARTGHQFFLIP